MPKSRFPRVYARDGFSGLAYFALTLSALTLIVSVCRGAGAPAAKPLRYLFVSNCNRNTIASNRVDAVNGRVSRNGKIASGSTLMPVVVGPSGKYVYVENAWKHPISRFPIEPDGRLTPLPMPTNTVATGRIPMSLAPDPSGKYIYVTNGGDNTVSQFTIGPGGRLTPMLGNTVMASLDPRVWLSIPPANTSTWRMAPAAMSRSSPLDPTGI